MKKYIIAICVLGLIVCLFLPYIFNKKAFKLDIQTDNTFELIDIVGCQYINVLRKENGEIISGMLYHIDNCNSIIHNKKEIKKW